MEIDGCNRTKRKNNPITLLPTEDDDDRPPDLIVTSSNNKKPKYSNSSTSNESGDSQSEDFELRNKTDREINEAITRLKEHLKKYSGTLRDGGDKLSANLRRHEAELERRVKRQLEKVENGCEETIQVSDSDDGDLRGKNQSDQKCLSSPNFTNFFLKKLDDKDSRTVNAFGKELSAIKPCQGRKVKPKNQVVGKGRSRTTGLSSRQKDTSRSSKTHLVDSEKHVVSSDDKKDDDSTCSVSEPNSPQVPPSRVLRPRVRKAYHVVDEEPPVQATLQFMESLDPCIKDVKLYFPSRDDPNAVEVNHADMTCLAPEACLSSSIMNFYIRYIQQPTSSSESKTCHYHFFNTYFYNKLEKLSYEEDSFRKFRKWWKGVSIFEKAYILLPVHENVHWSLVIICLPTKEDELGPILLHLDSLGLHNSKLVFDNIKRFLKEEWSYLRKSETPLDLPIPDEIWENLDSRVDHKRVTVPQQQNDFDCGLFVLFYMERFINEAPKRIRKKDLSMFGKQWFRPHEASNLRSTICKVLVEEFKKVKEKESTSSPQELSGNIRSTTIAERAVRC